MVMEALSVNMPILHCGDPDVTHACLYYPSCTRSLLFWNGWPLSFLVVLHFHSCKMLACFYAVARGNHVAENPPNLYEMVSDGLWWSSLILSASQQRPPSCPSWGRGHWCPMFAPWPMHSCPKGLCRTDLCMQGQKACYPYNYLLKNIQYE
jgi:hypothetical protein